MPGDAGSEPELDELLEVPGSFSTCRPIEAGGAFPDDSGIGQLAEVRLEGVVDHHTVRMATRFPLLLVHLEGVEHEVADAGMRRMEGMPPHVEERAVQLDRPAKPAQVRGAVQHRSPIAERDAGPDPGRPSPDHDDAVAAYLSRHRHLWASLPLIGHHIGCACGIRETA